MTDCRGFITTHPPARALPSPPRSQVQGVEEQVGRLETQVRRLRWGKREGGGVAGMEQSAGFADEWCGRVVRTSGAKQRAGQQGMCRVEEPPTVPPAPAPRPAPTLQLREAHSATDRLHKEHNLVCDKVTKLHQNLEAQVGPWRDRREPPPNHPVHARDMPCVLLAAPCLPTTGRGSAPPPC